MKKLLSSVSFSIFALCLTIQSAHAMKREQDDERTAIVKVQPQTIHEKIMSLMPDELWSKIFDFIIHNAWLNRYNIQTYSALEAYHAMTLVSKKWNEVAEIIALKWFESQYTDLFVERFASKIFDLTLPYGSKLTDMGLKQLTNLTSLDLGKNNEIKDDGIKNLATLTSLSMAGNTIITGAGLEGLTNLTNLNWGDYGYEKTNHTILGIETLVKLKTLKINSSFTDEVLKNFANLTDLCMQDNKILTDEGISVLTSLTKLNLSDSPFVTNKGMKSLTSLTYLETENSNITDEWIEGLINLEELEMVGNPQITGSGFEKLTRLTSLYCEPNDKALLTNDGIKHLINITWLRLSYVNEIGDDAIRGLTNLTYLDLQYHPMITLDGVKDLPNLQPEIREQLAEIKDLRDRAHAAYDEGIQPNTQNIFSTNYGSRRETDSPAQKIMLTHEHFGEAMRLLYELKLKYPQHLNDQDRHIFQTVRQAQVNLHNSMVNEFDRQQ